MNNLSSLLMELLEIGSAKLSFMILPDLLQNNTGTSATILPNSSIRIDIPNTTKNKNETYNIPSYILPEFIRSLNELLKNPLPTMMIPDMNGNQLSFTPTGLYRNGQPTNGYNMSIVPQNNNFTQVTTNDIQRLLDTLNQLNIHTAEAFLISQFKMLKNDLSANGKFNSPGTTSQNGGINSVINSNIIDDINNGNKNNNGDRNKNQTSKSPFNDNASPYNSNSGSTTSSKNNN